MDRSEDEDAQSRTRCNEFWRYPEPTQNTRGEIHDSPEMKWMHMEEIQPESAADGSGGLGSACRGDPQATPQSSDVPLEVLERLEEDSAAQKKEAETT